MSRKWLYSILLLEFFLLIISPSATLAYQSGRKSTARQQQTRESSARAELVKIQVSVTDQAGNPVTGLKPEDFEIYEDSVRQEIKEFKAGDQTPLSLAIALDVSGSMSRGAFDRAGLLIVEMAKNLGYDDEYALITYNERPRTIQDFTEYYQDILSAMREVGVRGGTAASGYAIDIALRELRLNAKFQKWGILLISTDFEGAGRATLDHILQYRVPVYVVNVGNDKALGGILKGPISRVIKSYVEESGGRFFSASSDNKAPDVGRDLARELRSQYSISYIPTNTNRQGRLRQLKVVLKDKNLKTRTLSSYYEPRY